MERWRVAVGLCVSLLGCHLETPQEEGESVWVPAEPGDAGSVSREPESSEPGDPGAVNRDPELIIGGDVDDFDAWPSVVRVAAGCTGTLIGPRTVLTAAHCVCDSFPVNPPQGEVVRRRDANRCDVRSFVQTWQDGGFSDRLEANVAVHPDYFADLDANGSVLASETDLAILTLDDCVAADIPHQPLATNAPVQGEAVTVVGFGRSTCDGQAADGLRRFGTNELDQVDMDVLVIDHDDGDATTWKGDSGGPLIGNREGADEVIGVTSRGSCGVRSLFTQTWTYRGWIQDQRDAAGVCQVECLGPAEEACGNCGTRRRVCDEGEWTRWGACQEPPDGCPDDCQPAREVCNGRDDDCDGQSDEGVLNACGACGAVPAEVCFNDEDDDCDGQVDDGCGSFVSARTVTFAAGGGRLVVDVPRPSAAVQAVGFVAVRRATEHPDDQCDWQTSTRAVGNAVRFEINVEHCGASYGAEAFAADLVVVGRVDGPGNFGGFDLRTGGEIEHSAAFDPQGGSGFAVCSAMSADGQGDVDYEWSCNAGFETGNLIGSAREQHGNGDSFVSVRILALAFGPNVRSQLLPFDCNTDGQVRIVRTALGPGRDHRAFILPNNFDTDTKDHLSFHGSCTTTGGEHRCTFQCDGSADRVGGHVLLLDGDFGLR